MSVFVPIDRASIQRNARAGQSVSHVPGMARGTAMLVFEARSGTGEQDRMLAMVTDLARDMGHTVHANRAYDGLCYVDLGLDVSRDVQADVEALMRAVEGAGGEVFRRLCTLEVAREAHSMYHAPIPPFSYAYVPTDVACDECGARFPHTELRSEETADGDGYSERVCPRCGGFECCDLVYEPLTRAVAEAALLARAEAAGGKGGT